MKWTFIAITMVLGSLFSRVATAIPAVKESLPTNPQLTFQLHQNADLLTRTSFIGNLGEGPIKLVLKAGDTIEILDAIQINRLTLGSLVYFKVVVISRDYSKTVAYAQAPFEYTGWIRADKLGLSIEKIDESLRLIAGKSPFERSRLATDLDFHNSDGPKRWENCTFTPSSEGLRLELASFSIPVLFIPTDVPGKPILVSSEAQANINFGRVQNVFGALTAEQVNGLRREFRIGNSNELLIQISHSDRAFLNGKCLSAQL